MRDAILSLLSFFVLVFAIIYLAHSIPAMINMYGDGKNAGKRITKIWVLIVGGICLAICMFMSILLPLLISPDKKDSPKYERVQGEFYKKVN